MRAVFSSWVLVIACGGRTVAGDPIYDDETPSSGVGGASMATGGTGARPTTPPPMRGGAGGKPPFPTDGARPGTGGFGVGATGAAPPVGGAPGKAMAAAQCEKWCKGLERLCSSDILTPSCFDACYEGLAPGARCARENAELVSCMTRELDPFPAGTCSDWVRVASTLCPRESAVAEMCGNATPSPECVSTGVTITAGACVGLQRCGQLDFHVVECATIASTRSQCTCQSGVGAGTTFTVESPVEKACFIPELARVCEGLMLR